MAAVMQVHSCRMASWLLHADATHQLACFACSIAWCALLATESQARWSHRVPAAAPGATSSLP